MSIVPWRPIWDLDKWFDEGWPEVWEWPEMKVLPRMRAPRMDVYEKDNNVVAEVELPGVDPKDIDVKIEDNALSVEAKSEEKNEEKGKGYYRKELGSRYYKRVVALPSEVDADKAAAEYENGILKVVVPKLKPKSSKKKGIKVKVRDGKK